jgi:2-isopropylmalate synthase
MRAEEVIHDWNVADCDPLPTTEVLLVDESLRDGVQSPSVVDPPIEAKKDILRLMDALGIQYADIGLPGAGPRAVADVTVLGKLIAAEGLKVKPQCAARTVLKDVQAVLDCAQAVGQPIEVMTFIGSSPIRQYAEGWDLDRMLKLSAEAIDLAVKAGLPCSYVTEDTVRSPPEVLEQLFANAIEHGAHRLVLCDTVGHATPDGARALVRFARSVIVRSGVPGVGIDWHGHNDRGLALPNTIAALEAGATRLHGCGLGIGERVGNTALDQLIVNLRLLGVWKHDVSRLWDYCRAVSKATQMPIPINYPVVGQDAFRTATGVHAAAIIKASKKEEPWLADRIYSGVPAGDFGREQEIEIGHMSGESNVVFWLERRGITPSRPLVDHIFGTAKAQDRTLTHEQVMQLVKEHQARPA